MVVVQCANRHLRVTKTVESASYIRHDQCIREFVEGAMGIFEYDLRFAIRQLGKNPGATILAVLTLALGIGANTAIFTVIESVLLRKLPYANSERLVFIGPPLERPGFANTSWLNFRDVQAQSRQVEQVAGYSEDFGVLENQNGSQSVSAPRVTTNLFGMLGVQPIVGRTFTRAEGQADGPGVAILSEKLWRDTFHADPNIVGRSVEFGGKAYSVVGVLPKTFHFPESMDPSESGGVWLPLQPTAEMLHDRGYSFFEMVGMLQPGVSAEQAQQELNSITTRINAANADERVALRVYPYQLLLTGPVRPVLLALLAALALVLLIACANVSNLLIARCLGRQQEFAVRAALGAGRRRLIAQMLGEGMLLSLMGCIAGVLIAWIAIFAVQKLPDGTMPRGEPITLHWTVLLILAVIATLTTVLSSLLPGLLVARANPQAALQQASRGVGTRSFGRGVSNLLVAVEVSLSTLLLIGTGLLFRTLWNLEQSNLGFDTAHVTRFSAIPADAGGFSQMAVSQDLAHAPVSVANTTYQLVLDQMRRAPGVESAALITAPPLGGMNIGSSFEVMGRAKGTRGEYNTRVTAVSGDYARTMGTPMRQGRVIEDSDMASTPFVAVINETFAKKYFAGESPLGRQINLGGKDTGMLQPYSIVGVLADQVDSSVGGAVQPFILLPEKQVPTTSLFYQALLRSMVNFVVKTRGNVPVAAEMKSIFSEYAPHYALNDFETMQQAVEKDTFNQRLGLYLVSSFAGLAVIMVIAGLYGVLSQLVSYRKREIGVRMALGATRGSVAQLILRQGSKLVGAGLVIGLVLSFVTGGVIKSFLYEVKPIDGWTYAGAALSLTIVGLIAALLPARRAASIEPMQALREE